MFDLTLWRQFCYLYFVSSTQEVCKNDFLFIEWKKSISDYYLYNFS